MHSAQRTNAVGDAASPLRVARALSGGVGEHRSDRQGTCHERQECEHHVTRDSWDVRAEDIADCRRSRRLAVSPARRCS